jgi:hypothetical protein
MKAPVQDPHQPIRQRSKGLMVGAPAGSLAVVVTPGTWRSADRREDIHLGDSGDIRFTGDFMGIEFHGDAHSHLDALCHVVYKGRTHNGFPIEEVVNSLGATKQTTDVVRDGIVGRGVMIDIPRLRGTAWIKPGEAVMADEIEAALTAQGLELRQGDIVFFRTGHARKRLDEGPWEVECVRAFDRFRRGNTHTHGPPWSLHRYEHGSIILDPRTGRETAR